VAGQHLFDWQSHGKARFAAYSGRKGCNIPVLALPTRASAPQWVRYCGTYRELYLPLCLRGADLEVRQVAVVQRARIHSVESTSGVDPRRACQGKGSCQRVSATRHVFQSSTVLKPQDSHSSAIVILWHSSPIQQCFGQPVLVALYIVYLLRRGACIQLACQACQVLERRRRLACWHRVRSSRSIVLSLVFRYRS